MHVVLVTILLVLVVLVVAIVYITIVAVITVIVLVVLLIVRRPLFAAYPGTVPLPAVRITAVILFAIALAAFLIKGTVLLIGR